MPEQVPIDQSAASKSPGNLEQQIARCDFRRSGCLPDKQLRVLNTLHEAIGQSVARALGGYLRVSVECKLVSVEQATYREVAGRIASPAYVATFTGNGDDSRGLLQLDLGVAFPIIDLLLGGEGKAEPNIREVTEIEEHVLEVAISIVCRELKAGWQPFGTDFTYEQRQSVANVNKLMPPEERVLVSTLDVTLPEDVTGRLTVMYPGRLTNALLRRVDCDAEYHPRAMREGGQRVRQLLMDSSFGFELSLTGLMIPAAELAGLSVGQVLQLGGGTEKLATAFVGGIPLHAGRAVRSGSRRAAQIVEAYDTGVEVRGQDAR